MDDTRRQLVTLAIVSLLVGGGYLGFELLLGPSAGEDPATASETVTSAQELGQEGNGGDEARADEGEAAGDDGAGAARLARERRVTIETDRYTAILTNLNAGLTSFVLKGERYLDEEGRPQELVTTDKEPYYPFHPELGGVAIPEDAVWEVERLSEHAVRFRWSGKGFTVTRKIEAGDGPYQLWATTRITNEGEAARPVRLIETTFQYVEREEEGGGFFARPSPNRGLGVCRFGGEIERKDREDLLKPHGYGDEVRFTGVESTYFATLLAAHGDPAQRCKLETDNRFLRPGAEEAHGSLFHVRLVYPRNELAGGETAAYRTLAYVGPKDPDALAAAGHSLPQVVDLGWFAFIGEYLVRLLRWIHDMVGNWGVAIILLTVLVKLVLYPLTEKSFQSMARMRHLKPEMDRINELYKDDREKKGAAVMELYRKHKINPLGGCLPTLLQLPVWFALYQSLSTNVELYHADFALWWTDLSSPDPFYVLPLSLGGLMFLQQKITPTTMDPAQAKMMLYFMPVMITFFMLFLPAGLCLYMVTNSALGIAQQQFIHWRLERHAPAEPKEQAEQPVETSAPAGNGAEPKGKPHRKATSKSSRRRSRGAKRRHQRGRA